MVDFTYYYRCICRWYNVDEHSARRHPESWDKVFKGQEGNECSRFMPVDPSDRETRNALPQEHPGSSLIPQPSEQRLAGKGCYIQGTLHHGYPSECA